MQTLRCLIVDDEKLAQELLRTYVHKMPNLELVNTASTALEAMQILQAEQVDLLFLDIQMPDLTGLEFLRSLRHPPATILTTAYSEYAVESYELQVIGYLLKPIEFERFFQAVHKAANQLQNNIQTVDKQPIKVKELIKKDYFFVKADSKIVKVNINEILYIEALQKYVRIHTQQERIVTLLSLSKILEELPSNQFIRIHRSYIINLEQIENVEGNMVKIMNQKLPISKGQRDTFMEHLRANGLNF